MKGANIVVDRQERCPLIAEVGDRIRLSSMKGPDHECVVTAVARSLVRVRWPSGEETTVVPAPGTLSVLAAGKAVAQNATKKKDAAKGHGQRDAEEHREQERAAQQERGEEDQGSKRPLR